MVPVIMKNKKIIVVVQIFTANIFREICKQDEFFKGVGNKNHCLPSHVFQGNQ